MHPGSPSFSGLPRRRRLKQNREFQNAKLHGKRTVRGCLIANWVAREEGLTSRLGVITGRKLGNAVARSRARRLLRQAFRIHQQELAIPIDLVLVGRASIVGKPFAVVEKDFLEALDRARLLKNPLGTG